MSIVIRRVGNKYVASVRPPHANLMWDSVEPLDIDDLVTLLLEVGCHQTDIGDAFDAADPEWLQRGRQHSQDEETPESGTVRHPPFVGDAERSAVPQARSAWGLRNWRPMNPSRSTVVRFAASHTSDHSSRMTASRASTTSTASARSRR